MKNKIICGLLLATMLLTVLFTSCSDIDTGYEEETSTIPDITLTLYGIKGEGTTDEAIEAVQKEINRYTQDKYKTTVELHFFTEEEYAPIRARRAAARAQINELEFDEPTLTREQIDYYEDLVMSKNKKEEN